MSLNLQRIKKFLDENGANPIKLKRFVEDALRDDELPFKVDFYHDLKTLLNSHSMENGSNTSNEVLAIFLSNSLAAFDKATRMRTNDIDDADSAYPATYNDVDITKSMGQLLMAAMAIITMESRTRETPDQVFSMIKKLSAVMHHGADKSTLDYEKFDLAKEAQRRYGFPQSKDAEEKPPTGMRVLKKLPAKDGLSEWIDFREGMEFFDFTANQKFTVRLITEDTIQIQYSDASKIWMLVVDFLTSFRSGEYGDIK